MQDILERQHQGNSEEVALPGGRGRRVGRQMDTGFWAGGRLCMTANTMVGTATPRGYQNRQITTTKKREPEVKHNLSQSLYQHRLNSCYALSAATAAQGGAVSREGAQGLDFLLHFPVNVKLL